jgi:hypothetical protein
MFRTPALGTIAGMSDPAPPIDLQRLIENVVIARVHKYGLREAALPDTQQAASPAGEPLILTAEDRERVEYLLLKQLAQ